MKYLNRFIERVIPVEDGGSKEYRLQNLPHKGEDIEKWPNISIFQQDWFEKLLPETFEIYSDPKLRNLNFDQSLPEAGDLEKLDFHKNDCAIGHNIVQFNYWYDGVDNPGDETKEGEPSCLEFDIVFVKNVDGLKLIVDITYGDNMAVQFSIESPNKVNVIHYTGIGSIYDGQTHWGFSDKSINDLVKFFNAFNGGINITPDDLSFLDKHKDDYVHDVYDDDHFYTDSSDLISFGNSFKKEEQTVKNETNRYINIKSFNSFVKKN